MPGAATIGRARNSSFMGLPKGALNITIDGVNAQDNLLKSNDGFFTIIRPRVESIEEFSISTAGQGSDKSAEGAVQINFETKRGGNEYHGGVHWQHRNDFLNANYWFSNRDGLDRQRQRLNQWGGRIGGPVWKDKIFFFAAMDTYRNPSSQARTRTILSPQSLGGLFTYNVSAIPGTLPAWVTCQTASPRATTSSGITCTADVIAFATAQNATLGTPAPTALDTNSMAVLNAIESARTASVVKVNPITNPWLDSISFNNPGNATRRFPDLRLDWNITKNIQWTGIYHYNYFTSSPDFLNSFDQTYPVAPFNTNQGSQISNRNQWVTAVRWNISSNKSNEVRWGLQTAPVSFFPDLNPAQYPTVNNNLGTIQNRTTFPSISAPFLAWNGQGRNVAVSQLIETFTWAKGKHSITLGGSWTRASHRGFFGFPGTYTTALGLTSANAPLFNRFSTSTFPGAAAADLTNARALYAMLTGVVSGYTGTIAADESALQYAAGANQVQRSLQHEYGFYGQDSWRVFPTLTFNFGLRWEFQPSPFNTQGLTFRVAGQGAGIFGVSGSNFEEALFHPGQLISTAPYSVMFEPQGDQPWYDTDMNNLAPNVGLAWQPNFENKLWNTMFGGAGKTVFRASYAVTLTREGLNNFTAIAYSNPGVTAAVSSAAVAPAAGACPTGNTSGTTFPVGCLTLSQVLNGNMQSAVSQPGAFPASGFALTPFSNQSANAMNSGSSLATPLVHNWSFGIQREINPNLVVELRYIGNHGSGLWRQMNVNEVNIFENGFLTEFGIARQNLAICRANQVACRTAAGSTSSTFASFANLGLAGQQNLPIMNAAYTGTAVNAPTNSNFSGGTNILWLDNGAAGAFANNLAFTSTFVCNLLGRDAFPGQTSCTTATPTTSPLSLPVNFWMANPHAATGGAFLFTNDTHSTFNALTVEVRQRLTKGLQFNANYTYGKALTNYYGNSAVSFAGFTTLRNKGFDKVFSPFDLRHAFKFNFLYSLPFGPGRKWSSSHGFVNRIIEGWEFSGITRWQSGRVFQLTSGNDFRTVNQNDAGVELVGINRDQLQSMLEVRKLPTGQVFFFPASLIGTNGSNTNFIRPCRTAGQLCQRVFLTGPSFFRPDLSIVKRTKIYEKWELEFRAQFLNAFNNINFFFPGDETSSAGTHQITGNNTFGQITNAFRDISTTDDNGGRIIELVFRINF
jgi:hypothetical protein